MHIYISLKFKIYLKFFSTQYNILALALVLYKYFLAIYYFEFYDFTKK